MTLPFETARVDVDSTVGAATWVFRPLPGTAFTVTRTDEPNEPSPLTRTLLLPLSPPSTTLTILRLESYAATPSSQLCGVVRTMLPACAPYQR